MIQTESLLLERGPIARLTLNRPEKLNALNHELGWRLIETLEAEGFKPDVRVIVIAGDGRSFCAGDDVSGVRPQEAFDRSEPLTYATLSHYYQFQRALRRVPKPVIVQVHGHCLGAGMDLVLGADYAIVDTNASLGLVFVKRAFAAGMVLLPRHVGLKQATRLLYEGETFSPGEALAMGLVSKVSEPGQLAADVDALAGKLAQAPTRTSGYIYKGRTESCLLSRHRGRSAPDGLHAELRHTHRGLGRGPCRVSGAAGGTISWHVRGVRRGPTVDVFDALRSIRPEVWFASASTRPARSRIRTQSTVRVQTPHRPSTISSRHAAKPLS
ncbi:MAG: enoyl-CoA hydratase/isomerase family protein [Dehalococcoidia bacterium]